MTLGSQLLAATLTTPLAMLAACIFPQVRGFGKVLLPIAPVPALLAALLTHNGTVLTLPSAFLGLVFELDRPGALLLGAAALLWIAAGVYACAYRRASADDERFVIWWLATLTGSLGVFIVVDLPGFYLFFTIVSLSAYWLVVDDATSSARRAGIVYVSFALLSEAFLLLAFVLLAASGPGNSLLIRDAVTMLASSPLREPILVLIIFGFGVKIALVPLHVWMPLTYTAAPIPVAAVLSGAAVKAGVIGLIRFLPFGVALPAWGEALAVLGLFSAFYGVAIGVTQRCPKTVLAYSSISQMGVIATVLGMGLATGSSSVTVLAAFYALHHVLVKGGLFLGLGVIEQSRSRGLWPVLLPAAVIALGLAGLPLTGGALAKLAVKEPLGEGLIGAFAMLSTVGSTLLMLHFLRLIWQPQTRTGEEAENGAMLVVPWLAIALATFALPWLLYTAVTNAPVFDMLAPTNLWDSAWPVVAGGLAALVLRHWERALPSIPAGDVLILGRAAAHFAEKLGAGMERIDGYLRRWPAASVALLVIAAMLAGAMYMAP
jgi:formate hydrogenlyase subunit 3/multisubunit Na+/H+ antiporter MnhD subunit